MSSNGKPQPTEPAYPHECGVAGIPELAPTIRELRTRMLALRDSELQHSLRKAFWRNIEPW